MTKESEIGRSGGPGFLGRVSFLGDDSYPTGGTAGFAALVAALLPATGLTVMGVVQQNNSDHICRYDKANDKLVVQLASTGAEVANAVDLSSVTFELLVFGK
jgi:hypothetical protein